MAKKLIIATILFLGAAGLAAIGVSLLEQLGCSGQLLHVGAHLKLSDEQQIFGDKVVYQTFVASRDNLDRFEVVFQTYNRANSQEVIVELREMGDGEDLAAPPQGGVVYHTAFPASSVDNLGWRQFRFPPITNSGGRAYAIAIQSPQSSPGDAIAATGMEQDVFQPGTALLNAMPLKADLAFKSCYQLSPTEKIQLLLAQIGQNRPGVWGDSGFYLILLTIYAGLMIALGWHLLKLAQ
jgi:hypothetical protein